MAILRRAGCDDHRVSDPVEITKTVFYLEPMRIAGQPHRTRGDEHRIHRRAARFSHAGRVPFPQRTPRCAMSDGSKLRRAVIGVLLATTLLHWSRAALPGRRDLRTYPTSAGLQGLWWPSCRPYGGWSLRCGVAAWVPMSSRCCL